jgi:serine/threonine-protein kinase
VKLLHPTGVADRSTAVESFKREALGVARLRHPNIVTIFDYSIVDPLGPFLVFEYLRGRTVAQELEERGPYSEPDATELVHQVCTALDAAHRSGVLHRDLKPQNLFMEEGPEGRRIKILDFGLALLKSTAFEGGWSDHSFVGTPHYVAPEQCEDHPASVATDVYALGCVLYEMLTARPPITAPSVAALLLKKLTTVPLPPSRRSPGVSKRMDEVVLEALAIDPAARFATAADFGAALASAAGPTVTYSSEGHRGAATSGKTNLPQPTDSFVGRREYFEQFAGALADSRLVTLAGPGGIGKTRLAI